MGPGRVSGQSVLKEIRRTKLKRRGIITRHSGAVSVLKYYEKKNVTMMSTYYSDKTKDSLSQRKGEG